MVFSRRTASVFVSRLQSTCSLHRLSCRASVFLVWAAVLAFALGISSAAQAQQLQVLQNHVRAAVSDHQAVLAGAMPPDQKIQASIVLPLRNSAALTSLLGRLYDPSSPDYRHFLTVAQFTDQFGPTSEDFQAVVAFAQANGLTVTQLPANRLVVPVAGTVAQISAAFNVQMNLYQHPTENRTFFSPDREPSLNLSVKVAHISGLDNYSLPRSMSVHAPSGKQVASVTGSGPGGSYLGSDMRAAYYGGTTLNGTGQAVGLFEFEGYLLSDVNLTFSNAGQTYAVPINNVLVDGATGAPVSGDPNAEAEVVLDIVQAIGMAPGLSQVRVYIGSNDADILNSMVSENVAKQISSSWLWAPADPTVDDVFFQEMSAQGQSFFVASGDDGAYDVANYPYIYPGEDQYVTAVGGTHLTTSGAGGGWVSETVWNSGGGGSSGGISPDNISIPSWQVGLATTANGGSTTLRNVPDVAMEGDFDNYNCRFGSCDGGWAGTSFASPRWAGFMALVNQQAVESGNAPGGGLGFINPAVYRLAQGSSTSSDFHDITVGNNDTVNQPLWFNAEVGYDLTTGWGSANGQSLINDLAGPQVPGFWLDSSQSTIGVNPGGTATATLSITGADGFNGSVNLAVSSGLPTGVTASFSPNPATGSSVLTLTASSSAPSANQAITITGTSGTLTASTNVTVGVHAPSFTLAASPASVGINQGASSTSTISVLPLYGFTGSVNLSIAGLPAGVTASFSPTSTTGTSTLTLTVSNTATPGNSSLTITGTSGTLTATTNVAFSIQAPSFTLYGGSTNIGQGSSGNTFVEVLGQYGFTGSVNLTVSGLPNGVTASFSPNPTTGGSTLTFTASTSASVGQSAVTITGTSGALSATTTVNLGVYAPTFTLGGSPSLNLGQGNTGNIYVSVNPQYGFTGSVTLSVSGLPSGVSGLWTPNPTTGTSNLVLVASSSAKVGQYNLTITGVSGNLTATTTLALGVYAPSFSLSSYSPVNIGQGTSGITSVYVNPQYGFTGSVKLAVTGLPSGVTASFSPNPATGLSQVTLTASSTAAVGQYPLTVTGTSGTQSATTTFTLGVYVPAFIMGNYGGITVGQGSSSSNSVYVESEYGFTGNVSLSVSGLPSGATASFSPNPTNFSMGNSTLTVNAGSTTPVGQYPLTVTGTSGTRTASTALTLSVYKPTFTIYNSGNVTLGQGTSTTTYVGVNSQYGFAGGVTMSVSGLPSGVTALFSPNPTTGNSQLTLTASSTTALGQYPLTITGTSGGVTATTSLTLGVYVPSFALTAYDVAAGQGSSASSNVYVNSQYGFAGGVNLSVSGLPSGVTASFSPNPTNSNSTLNLNIAASAPVGTSTVTVTGTSGSETVTTTFQLSIYAPTFTLYNSTGTLSLNEGANGSVYVYINPQYGFTGNVAFTVSGLPSGVTAFFSPNPATANSILSLTASSTATPGQATVTITGTSGSTTTSTSFTLMINSPGFSITTAPSEVFLFPGSSETSTVAVVAQNGFSGSVNYAVSGLPSGVTASFSPNPSSGATSILTLTAAATAAPASGTVTITATSGSLSATTSLPVTVRASQAATATTLALSSGSSPVASGTAVTATATVTAGPTPLTTGQVNFCDAAATLCDALHLLGTAQLTSAGTAVLPFIPSAGSHSYKAVFAGTNSNGTSASAASSLTVTPTTTIAQSGSAGNYTLTATVTGNGAVAPSGKVSFVDTTNGNAVLGSATLSSGAAAFSLNVSSKSPTVGSQPQSVATGDFNGDGIPDLAVANFGANTITILLGNGDGTFNPAPAGSLQTGNGPYAVVVGDFNRDGHADLAVTLSNNNSVNVFLGNGDGTFTPSSLSPPTGQQPTAMVVGDYNGDGLLDLAVVNGQSSTITILLGNGDGTFTVDSFSPLAGNNPGSMVRGDFNGDGVQDLAVVNTYNSTVTILLGAGDGTFTLAGAAPTGNYPTSLAAGDLNGDGKLDLVVSNEYSDIVTVLLGNGDGTFTAAASPSTSSESTGIVLADLNGDGKADIVIANSYSSNVTVMLGNGDGTFAAGVNTATGTYPQALAVGDWNGDGIQDIVTANSGNSTLTVLTSQLAQKATASASGISPIGQLQHAVDASYAGDSVYVASTSGTIILAAEAGPPAVTLSLSPASITTTQALTVTIAVKGNPVPTGSVTLTSGSYTSAATPLSGGSAAIVIPAGTLPIGTDALSASYTPDSKSMGIYTSATGSGSVTVTQNVTVGTTTSFVLSNGNLTFTATVAPVTGSGIPTGNVSFYAGQTLLGSGTLTNGVASYTATSFPTGNANLTAQYGGDANFTQSTSASIPVLNAILGSSSLTVASAGSVSDVLTFAVAPGYSGTLQLTCSGLPQNATCTFAPSSVSFTGSTNTEKSTLTIQTGATASLSLPASPFGSSRATTWAAMLGLPSLLALALASRRRKLRIALRTMAVLLLLGAAANSLTGCAGGGGGSTGGGGGGSSTTPAGTYTVQVVASGSSGLTQTTSLSVKVQQ